MNEIKNLIEAAKTHSHIKLLGDPFNCPICPAIVAAEEWLKGKKPVVAGDGMTHWYSCPKCKEAIAPNQLLCDKCTTHMDWS